jgi:rRNA maturation protein Nop10
MEFVGFWLLCAVVVAVIAASRGRSGFGWFLLACVISPLLAVILVLALGSPSKGPTAQTHTKCPECREFVLRDARKCKHCGAALALPPPLPEPADNRFKAMGIVAGVVVAVVLTVLAIRSVRAAERSAALRAEFVRLNPCPATGQSRGACPGYQVDHRLALCAGGTDYPSNMQWLSEADHKAKTRADVGVCRAQKAGVHPK